MKVTTDACIFGAVLANFFKEKELHNNAATLNYLDIGIGTGLLSMMLAQKTSGTIDGVELDSLAFNQALENVNQSAFAKKIKLFNTNIIHFGAARKYDAIVCNPPFFENGLHSPDIRKNAAKHDTSLTLPQLINIAWQMLLPAGLLAVLLPYHRTNTFLATAVEVGFYPTQIILLRHTESHPVFRSILFLSNQKTTVTNREIIIKESDGQYTYTVSLLLKDYYLYL